MKHFIILFLLFHTGIHRTHCKVNNKKCNDDCSKLLYNYNKSVINQPIIYNIPDNNIKLSVNYIIRKVVFPIKLYGHREYRNNIKLRKIKSIHVFHVMLCSVIKIIRRIEKMMKMMKIPKTLPDQSDETEV